MIRTILAGGALAAALVLAPAMASAGERIGDGLLGAAAGAVVGGPVGALAGGAIGYAAGPHIAHHMGIHHHHHRHARRVVYERSRY